MTCILRVAFLNSDFETSELDGNLFLFHYLVTLCNSLIVLMKCFDSVYPRNLLGEDLGPLNSKELEQLERQLESSLKQVRSTKVTNLQLNILVNMSTEVIAIPNISSL